jgi:hypothetical protein
MKKSIFTFLLLTSIVFLMSSCMTTKTSVGKFKETQGTEYTYAKGKQLWLFWGIFPLGRTNVNTPGDGNCEIVTRFNVGDALISGLTGGILTSYTIKVKAKK